ncbi:hypothetical protein [Pedobacter lusitanus]|uniref:hypothetical protein n=1 Tax=Pedobacter lusitanus TaxID=1503925 RepID=UPI0032AFE9B2
MRTLKFFIVLFALFLSKTYAQATTLNTITNDPESGIYLTAADYKHNQLHLAGDQTTKNKFQLNDFFGGKTLTLNHNGKNYKFSKDSIYGYRDKKGSDYRFYKKHDAKYRILENRSLVIYEFQRPGDKQTGFKPLLSYYYSEGVDGEVYPLTIDNLKRTFKEQAAFDIIDANFKTDQDLVSYDTYNHMFRINRLLARI